MGIDCSHVDQENQNGNNSNTNQKKSPVPSGSTYIPPKDAIPIVNASFPPDSEEVKILTLGAGECGKSTLWRQLRRLYCGGFSVTDRNKMAKTIKQSIIEDMKNLIDAMEHNSLKVSVNLQSEIEAIKDLNPNNDELDSETAGVIDAVWKDPMIKAVYKNSNSIGLGENANYFFDNVVRISSSDYSPSDDDILKARIRTTGIAPLQFKIKEIKTLLVDVGGQKTERRNWERCFVNVSYLLFVVSLSDFDQLMFEDGKTRRTEDALLLFSSMANGSFFAQTPIFLVLNKLDIFEKKLNMKPAVFKEAYPDFAGNTGNVNEAVEHVKQSYLKQLNPNRTPQAWVEVITTTAMDDDKVRNFVQSLAKQVLDTFTPS